MLKNRGQLLQESVPYLFPTPAISSEEHLSSDLTSTLRPEFIPAMHSSAKYIPAETNRCNETAFEDNQNNFRSNPSAQ